MLTGCNLQELQARVAKAEEMKDDFIVENTRSLQAGAADQKLFIKARGEWYRTSEVSRDNLAEITGIPVPYMRHLAGSFPNVAASLINHHLEKNEKVRKAVMVRTIGNKLRAVLSDKFLRLDHKLALEVALPQLQDVGAEIKSVLVTERRMSIQFVTPRISGEVVVGDVVQAGGLMTNSEVGLGRYAYEDILYRLACLNGMVRLEKLGGYSRRHVTRRQGVELVTLDPAGLIELTGQELAKLMAPETFQRQLTLAQESAAFTFEEEDIPAALTVAEKQGLEKGESEAVLDAWIDSQDCSLWGLGNAITRQAHVAKPDRSVELERLGAKVITLPRSAWREV